MRWMWQRMRGRLYGQISVLPMGHHAIHGGATYTQGGIIRLFQTIHDQQHPMRIVAHHASSVRFIAFQKKIAA
jgi:hypothetical protein